MSDKFQARYLAGRHCCAAAALLVVTACVPVDHPPLRACATLGTGSFLGSTGGPLRIIPSLVKGVELEKASWSSYAGGRETAAVDGVDYRVTLRSTRDVPDTDVAVVYELRSPKGPPTLEPDTKLFLYSTTDYRLLGEDPLLHRTDMPQDIQFKVESAYGLISGVVSSTKACPTAVRVVPRMQLGLYLHSGASLADDPAALVARLRTNRPGTDMNALRVLDVTQVHREFEGDISVVVENMTDTVVTDMFARVPVFGFELKDTVEFLIPRIEPRAVISLRSTVPFLESAGSGTIYPVATLRGRAAADQAHQHLASKMPRIGDVKFAGGGMIPAGESAHLHATPVTAHGEVIRDYDDMPTQWSVSSTGGRVELDTTSRATADTVSGPAHRRAVVRASGAAHANVSATIGGITGSVGVTFVDPPGSAPPGPAFDAKGRRVLPDGTIEVENVCVVHPDGRVAYAPWLAARIAQAHSDSTDASDAARKRRVALARLISGCTR